MPRPATVAADALPVLEDEPDVFQREADALRFAATHDLVPERDRPEAVGAGTRHLAPRPARLPPDVPAPGLPPCNVLCCGRGRNAAHVVDWASGCAGPGGCDVAHCRDNLIFLSGFEAADEFLQPCVEITGVEHAPFWEIGSVLEHTNFTPERIAASERRLRTAVSEHG